MRDKRLNKRRKKGKKVEKKRTSADKEVFSAVRQK